MNKVELFGRITAEPELRQASNGNHYVTFSLAVDRRSAEKKTDFIRCIAHKGTADAICKYVHKGNQLCVVGSINVNKYDKDGETRESWIVNVLEIHFVSSRTESQPKAQASQSDDYQFEPNFDVKDDELPFSL